MSKESYKDVREKLEKMIISIRHSSKDLLNSGNEKIINDLEFDSVDVMTLITKIEEKFNIRFEEELLLIQNFETVSSLTELIEKLINSDRKKQ